MEFAENLMCIYILLNLQAMKVRGGGGSGHDDVIFRSEGGGGGVKS